MPKLLAERKQLRYKGARDAICNLCDLITENDFISTFRLDYFTYFATKKPKMPSLITPPK